MRRHVAVLFALALVLGGCGLGPGEERSGGAELRLTRDFGQQRLGAARERKLREGQTVMRFLRAHFNVDTRFGGRFVQKLKGLSGTGASGQLDWFYFVNGIEASVGASDYELNPGDVVQWDYRRWDGAMRVPAIVGAFPEPFLHGRNGKRFPVRVECSESGSAPCRTVKDRLRALGARATGATLGTSGARNVLRVVVAPWRQAKLVQSVAALEGPPRQSGVFARFAGGGRRLELLDPAGHAVRTAPPGSGLVAALAPSDQQLVWLVTGIDDSGVAAAARLVGRGALRDAYAVAATPSGPVKLPVG
jgi:uncharacterized protein DUF4430